jgi:hypothetical protein
MINVPRMPELSAKYLIRMAKADPVINRFLPDLTDRAILNKEYLFNVINTVQPSFFPGNIRALMKAKQEKIALAK